MRPFPASHRHAIAAIILGYFLASCQNAPTGPPSPNFTLSTTTLVFSNAVEREVTITNITSEQIDWRVLSSTASWLTGTPASGSLAPNASNKFVVRVDRRAVQVGTHTAALQIGAASYSSSLTARVEDGAPAKAALAPSNITLSAEQSTASVEVANTGSAELNWTVSGPSWMTLNPSSGSLPPGGRQLITISVDRSGLTSGEYSSSIALSSNGGSASVLVAMQVHVDTGLRLQPDTLDFGSSTTTLEFKVVNDGDQSLAWSAKPGVAWVTISHPSGNLPPRLGQNLTVQVSRAGLFHGTNQAPIIFSTSRGSVSATIRATVVPAGSPGPSTTKPPKMSITPVVLDFGSTATELNFRIYNEGDEALDWTSTPQASWISLPFRAGRVSPHTNSPVAVRVVRSGLTAGTYQSSIQFESGEESFNVVVTATVGASSTPPPTTPPPTSPPSSAKISVTPSALTYGTTETERSFLIQNTGSGTLTWTAQLPSSWSSLPTNSGQVLAGGSQAVIVRVTRNGLLAAGEYVASVQISSNGGTASVAISMEVEALPPLPTPPPPTNGSVNVRDYGALGNGLADDTRSFDAALAALGTSGGTLYVPEGTYLLKPKTGVPDRGLDLSRRSGITVSGDGSDRTTLRIAPGSYVGAGDTHLVFLNESARITFRDIAFDGNRQSATFADEQNHCVEVWSSTDVLFERVHFHQCRGDGIRLVGVPSPGDPWTDRVTIQDSRFDENGRSGIAVQRAVRNLKILRNVFERISDQSIDIEPTGGEAPTDVLIEGNTIRHSTYTWAVAIGGIGGGDVAKRFDFRNNRVENGSVMISKAHDVTVEGNVILGDPHHSAGLRLSHDMENATIVDNQIASLGQLDGSAGIQVVALNDHHPQFVVIRDNTISTRSGGVLVRDALQGITVDNNSIVGTGSSAGVLVTNVVRLNVVHSDVVVARNMLRNFAVGVAINTQGDAFANVVIQENDIDHSQSPSTATIGLLFDKTGPHESFAQIIPNTYGTGIHTTVVVRRN